jgi:hypothetical protein
VNTKSGAATAGISMGTALAMVLSFQLNHSILWAIVHGIFSWFYVIYRAFKGLLRPLISARFQSSARCQSEEGQQRSNSGARLFRRRGECGSGPHLAPKAHRDILQSQLGRIVLNLQQVPKRRGQLIHFIRVLLFCNLPAQIPNAII